MTSSYRYTNWDGSQAEESLDADDLLSSLADDLLNFGDLQHALRNLMQRGVETPQGDNMQGLRDMLQDLRQQRRDQLDKYNLSSVLEELKEALSKIIENEQMVDVLTNHWKPYFIKIANRYNLSEKILRDEFKALNA